MMKQSLNFILLWMLAMVTASSIQAQKIIFSPQWTPQAQFAGYYMAQEKGFYKDAGLDVEIAHPATNASESVMSRLKNKKSDIIMLQLMQAVLAHSDDFEIVNIAQTSQNNTLLFVTQPEYTSIEQLQGKRIACWSSGFSELATCLEILNDYHFEWIHFTTGINTFVSHAVDAIIAMEYNEYFQLMHCGRRITEKNCFSFADMVGNIPEDGLYCLSSVYNERKADFDLFAEMSAKGWDYAREHPEETLEVVIQQMKKGNIPYSRVHQKWMLEKTLAAQIDKEAGKATYKLQEDDFQFVIDVLKKTNQKDTPLEFSKFSGNK